MLIPSTTISKLRPAAATGNAAGETEQRLAALAVATAGDAVAFAPARGKKTPGLRGVARIEPEWVEGLAGHLLKRSYAEPHWEKRSALSE